MLVAKFNCPACKAALEPSAPLPSGRKTRCPKCSRVIVVPTPQDEAEEVEEVEEAEPERKRPASRRDAVEEDRRSRPRAPREDDEPEVEERSRKPRKKVKKAGGGGSGVKIALFMGLGLLLLVGLGVGGYYLVSGLRSGGLTNPRVRALNEATSVLVGVTDQTGSQSARPALVAVGKRLREFHDQEIANINKALSQMNRDPAAIQRAIDDAMKHPEKARAEMERREKEMQPMKTAMQNLIAEATRVNKVPGGKELLDAFWDAWGEGGKMVSLAVGLTEMRDNVTKATPQNFHAVKVGMTEQQVTDLLGKPLTIDTSKPGIRTMTYVVGVVEIKDAKVVKKVP